MKKQRVAVSRSQSPNNRSCHATGTRAQKVVSRRDMLSLAVGLKTKVGQEDGTPREREIRQQQSARQNIENTTQLIGPSNVHISAPRAPPELIPELIVPEFYALSSQTNEYIYIYMFYIVFI